MKLNKILILTFILTIPTMLFARTPIRTLYTSDKVIKPIYLSLGRSTLLKFRDKPVRVVIGNKNYHNLEYINNDVTIQPLGAFDTNLFVYTKDKRTYSFTLKVVTQNKYDDVVHVRWKSSYKSKRIVSTKKKNLLKFPEKKFKFKNGLQVWIKAIYKTHLKNSYVLHFVAKNNSKNLIEAKKIDISLTRANRKIKFQKIFFLNDSIEPQSSSKVRAFFELKEFKGISVNIKVNGEKKKTIISRRYL
jgi:hypothetical protein